MLSEGGGVKGRDVHTGENFGLTRKAQEVFPVEPARELRSEG